MSQQQQQQQQPLLLQRKQHQKQQQHPLEHAWDLNNIRQRYLSGSCHIVALLDEGAMQACSRP
jgi:hypothetical protein